MKSTYSLLFILTLSAIACKNESKNDVKSTSYYIGHWDLIYGELNGEQSPALEKIYFEFGADTSVKTNFTVSEAEETGSFQLKEDKLIQNTSEPIEYQIVSKTDSTFEMITALRGFDFKLTLKKNTSN